MGMKITKIHSIISLNKNLRWKIIIKKILKIELKQKKFDFLLTIFKL